VREAVKQALLDFLAPLSTSAGTIGDSLTSLTAPSYASAQKGWPLCKPVTARELLAVASRVSGVLLVNDVWIAEGDKPKADQISISGLELPRILGITVAVGDPMDIDQLRGQTTAAPVDATTPQIVPVPVIPEEC
jgi:hypothetical protein